ncbi:MAG: flagellar hook capping FlgD N-terminal domain-containing protein [Huintestinicola sp.]
MGNGINDLSAEGLTQRIYSKYNTDIINTNVSADETSAYMDFEGYLKLLTAQMSNQDFNDPMSDSEFIQQMASYSMMEAIKELTTQTAVSYSSSLIGKAVTVNDATGTDTGIVEAVTISNGEAKILVNGTQYSTSAITDVVDGDLYKQLSSLVGCTAEIKDGEGVVTGEITNIYISQGNGYIVLDKSNVYPLSAIQNIVSGEEEAAEGEDTDEEAGSSEDAAASAEVDTSDAAYSPADSEDEDGITLKANAAYDSIAGLLDAGYKKAVVANYIDPEIHTATAAGSTAGAGIYSSTNAVQSDAQAGIYGDYGSISESNAASKYETYNNSKVPEPYLKLNSVESSGYIYSEEKSSEARSFDRNGEEWGVTTVSSSQAKYKMNSLEKFDDYASTTSQFPSSSRAFADEYVAEAAYADYVGTDMLDIRYIRNTDITKRIDTSSILGYSRKGKPFTEIGFSGKGRLGEVVTWADGTQRVEIIGENSSTYLTTSGNYTLDEICNFNAEPGSLAGKLTPFETAIRYWSREYTQQEREEMASFEAYVLELAKNYPFS